MTSFLDQLNEWKPGPEAETEFCDAIDDLLRALHAGTARIIGPPALLNRLSQSIEGARPTRTPKGGTFQGDVLCDVCHLSPSERFDISMLDDQLQIIPVALCTDCYLGGNNPSHVPPDSPKRRAVEAHYALQNHRAKQRFPTPKPDRRPTQAPLD